MRLMAIDPGPAQSAYAVIDGRGYPLMRGKVDNATLRHCLAAWEYDSAAIEMVASYGMPVGRDVFQTCVEIGRFAEIIDATGQPWQLVYRSEVKLHHCRSTKAKDSNIRQALVDRFTPGQPNHGKGTKGDHGWFHGFHSDIWQAYALAVYIADTEAAA